MREVAEKGREKWGKEGSRVEKRRRMGQRRGGGEWRRVKDREVWEEPFSLSSFLPLPLNSGARAHPLTPSHLLI